MTIEAITKRFGITTGKREVYRGEDFVKKYLLDTVLPWEVRATAETEESLFVVRRPTTPIRRLSEQLGLPSSPLSGETVDQCNTSRVRLENGKINDENLVFPGEKIGQSIHLRWKPSR